MTSFLAYWRRPILALSATAGLLSLLACSAGGSSADSINGPTVSDTGKVALIITDAPSDQWAELGVIIRSVSIGAYGGPAGSTVPPTQIYDGSQDTVPINLVDLDSLGALLGKATIPQGTYNYVELQIDANPNAITLVPSLDAGGNPQSAIPSSQIEVNGFPDSRGWVKVGIVLSQNLIITPGQTSAVQLDFDLSHPLFVVNHTEGGTPSYVITFQVNHKPHLSLPALRLHHARGQVTSLSSDGKTFSLRTVHRQDLAINVDQNAGGTLFYDLDAIPVSRVFSTALPAAMSVGRYAKVQTRFQNDGSLTAVRVWLSWDPAKLPNFMPEGHVVGVDTTGDFLMVLNAQGRPVAIKIDDGTAFYFQGERTAIGSGAAFLSNIYRGFKVQVTVADPLAVPLVATEVDIQRAGVDGAFQNATDQGFSYQKLIWAQTDTINLGYDSGFSWWNFAFPATASSDLTAFIAKANATGTNLKAFGASSLDWNAAGSKWLAENAVFLPSPVSIEAQLISAGYADGHLTISYTYRGADGTLDPIAATLVVNLSSVSGAETLVTEFKRATPGSRNPGDPLIGVSPLHPTEWAAKLVADTKVRVFGIPKGDGSLDAYVVNIFN